MLFQSHTGEALAQAFHKMLVEHALTEKVRRTQCIFKYTRKHLPIDPRIQR